ncbi:hypothetical protein QLX41_gp181 [Listeria phage LMTA-94]|uniref:Uncharacterized protein n=4 Tax=Pecentumvirus TaxID=1857844 RepID=A0A060AC24_9CAUD|nr:metal-dependent phosphohydrolase [Listeria phage LMSP-25]YP_009616185.1 metal-dependent phosphohydrolase [Listeria phage LMTA-34]YP_009793463.1 hypothetical protein QLX42_gp188 [Listeria phage LMTA-57]YP_009793628.1 hypothetical protein QLX41_gp181 [Listeria phage LMTA-94]AIA64425.1 hypothetical protein [Listeria phage LMSP-25]AID16983.1 hypothetical protein [Listeria phage LMTA-34]AID17217.1 hypothetical protein [Listeria phage LMTA-94]AID17614.1 hypothetical protein [Listeria phage LMTA
MFTIKDNVSNHLKTVLANYEENQLAHVYRVAENFRKDKDEDAYYLSLLHDIFEDTSVRFSDVQTFLSLVDKDYLLGSLVHLTRIQNEAYTCYIQRLKQDNLAKKVKLAEILDYFSNNTIAFASQKEKYCKALAQLTEEDVMYD